MKIAFAKPAVPETGALFVGATEDRTLTATAAEIDRRTDGALTRAMAGSQFKGKRKEMLPVLAPAALSVSRVVLVGLGKGEDLDALHAEAIGGEITAHCKSGGVTEATVALDLPDGAKIDAVTLQVKLANGIRLRSYRFDKYKTKEKDDPKPRLEAATIAAEDPARAQEAYAPLEAVSDGVEFTRNLVSEPANILYPQSFAEECRSLTALGVEVEVLGEAEMQKLGMGSLLGVGQGSTRESQLVVMRWSGAAADVQPIAFIGKGVTFDTGGISIKPAGGMEDMKWDMGGAGTVTGLMKALAGRKAKANVIGVVGLVENMPDGNAQRPGDIVTSMSGQTIEVINTDAEGRLVLADALWYTQDRFKPQFMVNLATLTGAIIVTLGNEHAGLFANNDELADRISAAGKAVGETVWRLPLGDAYDKDIDSDAADMRNIGSGRGAGSIIAAQFLQRFVNKVPWAHLDIAGMAWSKKDKPIVPKGGTGYGVRLLDRLVADHYES